MRGPAWVRCEACDDWWCILHWAHAWECECPPVDEWEGHDPRDLDAVEYTEEQEALARELYH